MLSIRLTRTGKKHDPHYRIVVQEKRSKLNGSSVDIIGHYHPAETAKTLVINKEKAVEWMKKGAQPSDTVTNLFVREGILKNDQKVHNFFTPTKKEVAPVAEKATPEETTTKETPTEEPEVSSAPEPVEETVVEDTAPEATK